MTAACNSFVRNSGTEMVTPVQIDPKIPGEVKIGDVVFMAGYELTYGARFFGGLSGLSVSKDGSRMVAISDYGKWVSAPLMQNASGRLTGVGPITMAPLTGAGGTPINTVLQPEERDAAGLAVLPDGRAVVSFERHQRIWVYDSLLSRNAPLTLAPPDGLSRLRPNGGVQALAAVPDGRLVAIAARPIGGGRIINMWILGRDGRWRPRNYVMKDGFDVVGMTALADGRILVLERWYAAPGAIRVRLRELTPAMLNGHGAIDGKVIAELDPPLFIDDFEGIASRTGPNGQTLLYMISNNDFDPLQHTLLYQFRLVQ